MVNSDAGSEHRDALPADLDADAAVFAGAYEFPDNSRRRIPGLIYLAIAAACLATWQLVDAPVVNSGFGWAALVLGLVGAFSLTSGWRMQVDEKQATETITILLKYQADIAKAIKEFGGDGQAWVRGGQAPSRSS